MQYKPLLASLIIIVWSGCATRHTPVSSNATSNNTTTVRSNSNSSSPSNVKKSRSTAAPKVIAVNDKAAKKNFDGRLYYDLNGRRYWRNYNDGKYYLFDKSMYSDSAFIPHK